MTPPRAALPLSADLAICEIGDHLVPASFAVELDAVMLVKACDVHGEQRALFANDVSYFKRCQSVASVDGRWGNVSVAHGCPRDCGICESHESPVAAAIVELLDECNLRCSTCIAMSFPGAGHIKPIERIRAMISASQTGQTKPVVFLSGGEPTIHPKIIEALRFAADSSAPRVFLITNGLRISNDPRFVQDLQAVGPKLEIYLQFDSLRKEVLEDIRGEDLRAVRSRALERLEAAGIPSTLVVVVKRGLNLDEVGTVVRYGLGFPHVRGVTFQPIRDGGRVEGFSLEEQYLTLTDIRSQLLNDVSHLRDDEFIPHPLSPMGIALGYLDRRAGLQPVTRLLPHESFFYLPGSSPDHPYDDLFRIAIVAYSDQHSFLTSIARRSCLAFVSTDLRLIPADAYYLFYAEPPDESALIQIEPGPQRPKVA